MPDTQQTEAAAARHRAIALVSATVAELMEFWNFKPSMGRIWAVLYLSQSPLDADAIEGATGLSAGMVSTTLGELLQWGVVKRVPTQPGQKRLYTAETDLWSMIARVFRERELRLIERVVHHLEEALRILDEEGKTSDPEGMLHSRFLATRVQKLLELAQTGHKMMQKLSETGTVNFRPIREWLSTTAERTRRVALR